MKPFGSISGDWLLLGLACLAFLLSIYVMVRETKSRLLKIADDPDEYQGFEETGLSREDWERQKRAEQLLELWRVKSQVLPVCKYFTLDNWCDMDLPELCCPCSYYLDKKLDEELRSRGEHL